MSTHRTIDGRSTVELFTIGYEGRSIDEYLQLLEVNRVAALVDVRRNPISHKRGFSKSTLRAQLDGAGIAYYHLPELGVPSADRRDLKTAQDYQALLGRYERSLPERAHPLQTVCDILRRHSRVALTCFERDHDSCHRSRVANYVRTIDPLIRGVQHL